MRVGEYEKARELPRVAWGQHAVLGLNRMAQSWLNRIHSANGRSRARLHAQVGADALAMACPGMQDDSIVDVVCVKDEDDKGVGRTEPEVAARLPTWIEAAAVEP